MSDASTARRVWLPLPVVAVQVRVVLDSASDLDALEEAIVGLLRIASRDAKELARRLHISHSLVLSALARLADRDIVTAPEKPNGLYACMLEAQSSLAAAARPGWAFYSSVMGAFLPTIVLAERRPSADRFRPKENVIEVEGDHGHTIWPALSVLEESLRILLGSREVTVLQSRRRGIPTTSQHAQPIELDGEALPDLGVGNASHDRIRSVVLERARKGERFTAWVPIDLLPRLRGSAVPVMHEPVIDPLVQTDSPITVRLTESLAEHDACAWSALQTEVERIRIDMSLVLTRAGIDSMEKLEEQVHRHALAQAAHVRLDDVGPPPGDEQLMEKVHEAQRWLVLAQKEHAFRTQARDAWAHVVEEMGAKLVDIARPHLEKWKRMHAQSASTATNPEERLLFLGLRGQLGPSEVHVLRAAKKVARETDLTAAGAGASLTLWLLPVVVLELDDARRYAGHVRLAVQRNPQLFDDLAELVAIRDYTFHEGRTRAADTLSSDLPEHIERRFLSVFAALHVGLKNAPA